MQLRETFGRAVSVFGAPVTGLVARARHARAFHARGVVHEARAVAHPDAPSVVRTVAERLEGPALVRVSSALFRSEGPPDLLGLAIRFRTRDVISAEADPGDQDLLFATARSVVTLGLAAFTTDVHDFLANDYFAIAPFDVAGLGRAKLRVRAVPFPGAKGASREERLDDAVAAERAVCDLEIQVHGAWTPCVRIEIGRRVEVDPAQLRFSPFRAGRGLRAIGFIHGLRAATYRASQAARS